MFLFLPYKSDRKNELGRRGSQVQPATQILPPKRVENESLEFEGLGQQELTSAVLVRPRRGHTHETQRPIGTSFEKHQEEVERKHFFFIMEKAKSV